jgi:hypothetical protein
LIFYRRSIIECCFHVPEKGSVQNEADSARSTNEESLLS